MPKATGEMSKRSKPKAPREKPGAARHPAGYQRCRCRGLYKGCGLVRSPYTRQMHVIKENKSTITHTTRIACYIRGRSLTSQFLEKQEDLLLKFLRYSINEFNDEESWDA